MLKDQLQNWEDELAEALRSILNYWIEFTPDHRHGGFLGRIDEKNQPDFSAPKGAVLNSRILYSFSASYCLLQDPRLLQMADRAYNYLMTYFRDPVCGGFYWTLNFAGEVLDDKKQVYAQAFALYGLCAYYRVRPLPEVEEIISSTVELIERYARDNVFEGYLEAFDRRWQPLQDRRLSPKDKNDEKTTNTNLHLLEAFTAILSQWPENKLRESLTKLANIFTYKIPGDAGHLQLFFTKDWKSTDPMVSYGHDIEAAWLMIRAAEILKEKTPVAKLIETAIRVAESSKAGLDGDGLLWYEHDGKQLIEEKHWWVQAEAMTGYFTIWLQTKKSDYLQMALNTWKAIQTKLIDKEYGEWYWGIDAHGDPMQGQDKVGLWKCPYHNARACIEIIRGLQQIKKPG